MLLLLSFFFHAAAAAAVVFPNSCSCSFHFSLFCATCSQPVLSFVLLDLPSLYSLNTPSHFDLCFVCASLHNCKPLVVSALLPLCADSISYLPIIMSFQCRSFHHTAGVVSSAFLSLAVSATIFRSPCC